PTLTTAPNGIRGVNTFGEVVGQSTSYLPARYEHATGLTTLAHHGGNDLNSLYSGINDAHYMIGQSLTPSNLPGALYMYQSFIAGPSNSPGELTDLPLTQF